MKLLGALAAALTFFGRHGTLVAAASIFVGLAVPGLAAIWKPYLGEAIVVMLTLAFLRVDPKDLRLHLKQPGVVAAATVWAMLVVPACSGSYSSPSGSTNVCRGSTSCWCCRCRRPA